MAGPMAHPVLHSVNGQPEQTAESPSVSTVVRPILDYHTTSNIAIPTRATTL